MRIDCLVGARPNFIKIAPLAAAMVDENMDFRLINTGQHYDYEMSGSFFDQLSIPRPDLNLGIGSGSHAKQTAAAMVRLEEEWVNNKADLVVLVGDVNSTLAGALAASKLNIPIAHVEAGYRSFDRSMPEEINRVVVDHLSSMLFSPTMDAYENLKREGIDEKNIFFVGNIMAQTLLSNVKEIVNINSCSNYGLTPKEYAIATIHRPENVENDQKLKEIITAFIDSPIRIVFPVHPRTIKKINDLGLKEELEKKLILTKPLSYMEMLSLLSDAKLALTDSGGLQEEACILKVPCLTIRNNTERVTTIKLGANKLINADSVIILRSIDEAVKKNADWNIPEKWDQNVAARILELISARFYNNLRLVADHGCAF